MLLQYCGCYPGSRYVTLPEQIPTHSRRCLETLPTHTSYGIIYDPLVFHSQWASPIPIKSSTKWWCWWWKWVRYPYVDADRNVDADARNDCELELESSTVFKWCGLWSKWSDLSLVCKFNWSHMAFHIWKFIVCLTSVQTRLSSCYSNRSTPNFNLFTNSMLCLIMHLFM